MLRVFLKIICIFFVFCGNAVMAQQRPNIILIVSDDHAFQTISAYGSTFAKTPNIDRIAREGVRFDQAHVTNSICGPSRAVILTGKYSHLNGFKDNDHSTFDGSQNTFIKELTKSGYQTAWIGKWHLESTPQGFSHWEILPGQGNYYNPDFLTMDGGRKRVEGYVANIVEDLSEKWLDERDPSKPFCLVIGHKNTHRNWLPDTTDLGMYDTKTFPVPSNFFDDYKGRDAALHQDMTISKTMIMGYDLKMFGSEDEFNKEGTFSRLNKDQKSAFLKYYNRISADLLSKGLSGKALDVWKYQRYMKDYLSTAASLDRNIGRTLNYLDKHKLSKNTVVIYVSDQGFYIGEHGWFDKRFMYEESFRTPMLMRYPGFIKPGTVNNNMVMNLDIAPTLLQIAGVPVPTEIQGRSFLPFVKGGKVGGRDALYYHYYETTTHNVSPHFGIKTKRYKLIRFYEKSNSWELYDLAKDKNEMHNLYGKIGYEAITASLKKELLKLIETYKDDEAKSILKQLPTKH